MGVPVLSYLDRMLSKFIKVTGDPVLVVTRVRRPLKNILPQISDLSSLFFRLQNFRATLRDRVPNQFVLRY
jgi:hypothetical protein